ncbi:hypothetical protein R6Z07F_008045 [Ovis aries]
MAPIEGPRVKKGLLKRLDSGEVVVGDGSYLLTLEKRGYVKAGLWTPEAVVEHPNAGFSKNEHSLRSSVYFENAVEAVWAVEVLKETGKPVAATVCIGPEGDMPGVTPGECAVKLRKAVPSCTVQGLPWWPRGSSLRSRQLEKTPHGREDPEQPKS